MPIRQRYGIRFLKPEHIEFLKSPETLSLWAGKSLKERCLLFHRHFGDHRINITLLRKFYTLYRIKRKKIKLVKKIDPSKDVEYEEWRLGLVSDISRILEDHYRIIYLDETIFTTKTIHTSALLILINILPFLRSLSASPSMP